MSLALKKAIIEIRYTEIIDTTKYIPNFNELTRALNKEFINSFFDFNTSTFIMQNPIQNLSCSISTSNIIISHETANDIDGFNRLVEKTIQAIRDKQLLNSLSRVGYRTFWGIDFSNIDAVDAAIFKSFNINIDGLSKFGKPNNIKVGFSTKENDYGLNYNFSSAINKELKMTNGMLVAEKETYCILGDFDVYIDKECKFSNLFKYTTDFKNIIKEKIVIFEKLIEEN